jgi:hypothetical protein
MSKNHVNDVDSYFDDSYQDDDSDSDFDFEKHSSKKSSLQNRRKIEKHKEIKTLREFMDTDDSYWGD